jgi:hypothetical protein
VSFVGSAVTVTDDAGNSRVLVTIDTGADAFGIIAVAGQASVEADQINDTVTFVEGTYTTITTSAGDDEVTFNVDLTKVAGYDAGERQYLRNDSGTIEWVTVGAC